MYWEEYADGSLSIYQNLICTKESQKVCGVCVITGVTDKPSMVIAMFIIAVLLV